MKVFHYLSYVGLSLFLLLLCYTCRAQYGNINYQSKGVSFFLNKWDVILPTGVFSSYKAYQKGANVLVFMEYRDGAIVEQRPWGQFQYGITKESGYNTVHLKRSQARQSLNDWIQAKYSLAEEDVKYRGNVSQVIYYNRINYAMPVEPPCDFDLVNDMPGKLYIPANEMAGEQAFWMPDRGYPIISFNRELLSFPEKIKESDCDIYVQFDVSDYLPPLVISVYGRFEKQLDLLRDEGFTVQKKTRIDEILKGSSYSLLPLLKQYNTSSDFIGDVLGLPCNLRVYQRPNTDRLLGTLGVFDVYYNEQSKNLEFYNLLVESFSSIYGQGELIESGNSKKYLIRIQDNKGFVQIQLFDENKIAFFISDNPIFFRN